MAFLSSLTLIPLFVAEREQRRLWSSSTSGTSNFKILLTQIARVARKNLLDEFYEAERGRSAAARSAVGCSGVLDGLSFLAGHVEA
jgi:hypothetical protein